MSVRVFALLFFLFFLAMSREPPWGDARVTFETARSLIERGRLDIQMDAPSYFFTVHDGKKYGFASLGNVIASVPSLAVFRGLRRLHLLPASSEAPLYALTSHLSSALLMAGAGGLMFRLARRRGASDRLSVLLALSLGLCCICFVYARSPYSESLQTFALLWLLHTTLVAGDAPPAAAGQLNARRMALWGVAAGIVFNAKLVYAVALPPCLLYLLWVYRRCAQPMRPSLIIARLAIAGAAFAPFFALTLLHNWIKTGSPFRTGYWGNLFGGELVPALHGYFLSPGQGMFWYSPPLLLGLCGLPMALRRSTSTPTSATSESAPSAPDPKRRETILICALLAIITLVNAQYFLWHGAYCWGPRLMVPVTPFLLLLALPWLPFALRRGHTRLRRLGVGLLLLCGAAVQAIGASLYWDHYIRIVQAVRDRLEVPGASPDYLPQLYYVPQFAPLRGHLWLLRHLARGDANLAADRPWQMLYPQAIDLTAQWSRLRVDWWLLDWLMPGRYGQGLVLLALFGMGAVVSGVWLLRGLRDTAGAASDDDGHGR